MCSHDLRNANVRRKASHGQEIVQGGFRSGVGFGYTKILEESLLGVDLLPLPPHSI